MQWLCIATCVIAVGTYLFRLKKTLLKDTKKVKAHFRWFSLLIYALVNTAAFIIILGPPLSCHGDGQTVMVVIFSGPITSLALLILGGLVDVYIGMKKLNAGPIYSTKA